MDKLIDTLLYREFEKKATEEQRVLVKSLAKTASIHLSLIRDTFPTYTLHNETHVLNVIKLMGQLLKSQLTKTDSLELAFLILSAYYHDIGMVFTEEERHSIINEVDFSTFLKKFPKAQLDILEFRNHKKCVTPEIPHDVAEWYCRWIHADRSAVYVTNLPDILWDGYPINEQLALLCKSHNYSITEVSTWSGLSNDFIGQADLLFCSLILRLSDILDFDNSRSPEEVYEYLGLSKRRSNRETISDVEWLKHLCSKGFIFPKSGLNERYHLKFASAPDEPAVEYDVREFLKNIEAEFEKCNAILNYTSSRWKNFNLPVGINNSEIRSKGYTYGEFRFTLQQDQILNLLMGENLYSDPNSFIRELLQNSIDTTRHRVVYEKSRGNSEFIPKPIEISSWSDRDGYTWVRVDDFGMGMNTDILTEYFLKVGKSYYQSEDFKIEQINLKVKTKIDFMPISKFGIGILSCFILGDRIEINTRRVSNELSKNAIRLSIKGLSSFFVLKQESENHHPERMPNEKDFDEMYRSLNDFGTSISVRLNSSKDRGDLNLQRIISQYVIASPIQINYQNIKFGEDYNKLIEKEWCEYVEYNIDSYTQEVIEEVVGLKFSESLKIVLAPLNFTTNSPTENLKGQAIIVYIVIPDQQLPHFLEQNTYKRVISIEFIEGFSLIIHAIYENKQKLRSLKHKYLKSNIEDYENSTREKLNNRIINYDRGANELEKRFLQTQIRTLLKSNKVNNVYKFFESKDSLIKEVKKLKEVCKTDKSKFEEFLRFSNSLEFQLQNDSIILLNRYIKSIKRGNLLNLDFERFADTIPDRIEPLVRPEIKDLYKDVVSFINAQTEFQLARREKKIILPGITNIINDLDQLKSHWLSHNGLYVPIKGRNSYKIEISNPIKGSFIHYNIALKDNLRPELTISREELSSISWEIFSTINYTFSRSIKYLNFNANIIDLDIFKKLSESINFTLEKILNDTLISADNFWALEPIFKIKSQYYSLVQIRNRDEEVVLNNPLKIFKTYNVSNSIAPSFLEYVLATLVNIGLDIEFDMEIKKIKKVSKNIPIIGNYCNYYPPLFFIKYSSDEYLIYQDNPLNCSHRFSKWLINNTESISEKYPALFERIKISVSREFGNKGLRLKNVLASINEVNSILKRLEELNFTDIPTKEIYLKSSDFGVL